MKAPFANFVPFFRAPLFLAVFPFAARSHADALAPAVCDAVRVFLHADDSARMTGGEI